MLHCQATMPSVFEYSEVVGTGGAWAICRAISGSPIFCWLTFSYKRHALVAFGLPVNGVPSVITQRDSLGTALAISRA